MPKPLLLLATVALAASAILFLETRFDTASPEARTVEAEPPELPEPPSEETEETEGVEGTRMIEETTPPPDPVAEREARYERPHEIVGPTGFVNTDGVAIGENLGEKVVLVDFWTYACRNCQNTQPYLNAWRDEYSDDGLLIIGVHKPEFEFEKDYAGAAEAVGSAGIKYPVVLDNNDATWEAYNQRFWPTMHLVDSDGFIRYKHIGEGAYEETEAKNASFPPSATG